MSVKAINQSLPAVQNRQQKQNKRQQSFTGSFNPVVTLMDFIDKGGFAASFIAQDGIGMVAPRIYEGLNRNREKDENGKKIGPLNWEFARREGIREILSGPSAFLIPLGMLSIIKKVSGRANNVHIDHINALGDDFASYAKENRELFQSDAQNFKKGYFSRVFENVLSNSTDNNLNDSEIKLNAEKFAEKMIEAESDKKNSNKLISEIIDEYSKIRKKTISSSGDELGAVMKSESGKLLNTNIQKLTQSLADYADDAIKHVSLTSDNIAKSVKNFNLHRAGTRVMSNLSMWGAVVAFYTLIPKLYNLGLKHDPGLKGLETEENNDANDNKSKVNNSKEVANTNVTTGKVDAKDANNSKMADEKADLKEAGDKKVTGEKQKDVAFTGLTSTIGEMASKKNKFSDILKIFEFNGASMTVPAMLTLLFGFCLPPRYINAKSDKERKEITVRDISSFFAILFGAKALSRAFSTGFAKYSGLALNIKPQDHSKSLLHKLKNYFTAGSGIEVLTSDQIVTKYSDIAGYKDGITGFFDFLKNNGGNVKKVLHLDKEVEKHAETIMETFSDKSLKDATFDEIKTAFNKAKGSEALEKIYTIFQAKDNKFINRAKTLNSAFGFASTVVLVPVFMMWLARYCENMTKKAVEKEKAMKAEEIAQTQNMAIKENIIATNKPTMAGFLK